MSVNQNGNLRPDGMSISLPTWFGTRRATMCPIKPIMIWKMV